jgi:hypothetical protein
LNAVFEKWAKKSSPFGELSATDLRVVLMEWVRENRFQQGWGHNRFELPRPRLLALVRFLDSNRDGVIDLQEFTNFYADVINDMEAEEQVVQKVASTRRKKSGERPAGAASKALIRTSRSSALVGKRKPQIVI